MPPDKKNEILEAAIECFKRFGYEKTTLDDIGGMIGLNKASLYYYYKNKESLFTEVVFSQAADFIQKLKENVGEEKKCRNKILRYLKERTRYIFELDILHQLSLESVQKIKPLFSELYENILHTEEEYLAGILEGCLKEGREPAKIAKTILNVEEAIKNNSPICRKLHPDSNADYSGVEEEILYTVSLILDGVLK